MKNNLELILLTNRYPYHPGEEFLKLELEYLCERFHKIHIIPVNATNILEKRELPSNVVLHYPEHIAKRYLRSKHFNKIKFLIDIQGIKWFLTEFRRAKKLGVKSVLKLVSWLNVGLEVRNYILKHIISDSENTTYIGYSYWLSLSTGLAMIKEKDSMFTAYSRGHGGDIYDYRHKPPYLPFKFKVIQNLDKVHLISSDGHDYLRSQCPQVENKLKVSRLGIKNCDEFVYPEESEILRLVSCSYMVPVKRLSLLIESLKLCRIKIHWTHIGDGPEKDHLERLASDFPDNITYSFLGNLSNVQVYQLYKTTSFDMFLNVSSSEGIPVSIMEAFSFGIPAAATNVGGTKELVNEANGMLLPRDVSAKQIAIQIEKFYADTDQNKRRKRIYAYNTWRDYFNAQENYTNFAKEISDVGESKI